MEKKKNIKTRIMAGALALMLSGTTSIAMAKDFYSGKKVTLEVVELNNDLNLKNDYEYFEEPRRMYGCDVKIPHAHQYENTNGDVKWFASEAAFIDGYEWTDNTKKINIMENGQCDNINESHANLYISKTNSLLIPIYSEEAVIDNEFYKTQYISFLDKEKCELLRKLGLFRVVDNLFILDNYKLRDFEQGVLTTYISLELKNVEKDEMIFKHVLSNYESGEKYPGEFIYNLLYPGIVIFTNEEKKECENNFTYVTVPIEKNYQKKIITPSFMKR